MNDRTCTYPACGRPLESAGYCQTHNRRRRLGKPMDAPFKPHRKVVGTCKIDRCDGPIHSLGMCIKHYRRHTRHGDPMVNKKFATGIDGVKRQQPCEVDGCDQTVYIKAWCRSHYTRWQRTRDVRADIPLQRHPEGPRPCAEEGCGEETSSGSWCTAHRTKRATDRWRDKRHQLRELDPDGYREFIDRSVERARQWRKKNPERNKTLELRKRAKRAAAPRIPFTGKQLAQRMAYWGNRCWMCHGPFEVVDHVKPIVAGGWHALANLRPACDSCNSSKSGIWPFPVAASTLAAA